MVTSVTKSNLYPLRSFCVLCPMFYFKNIRELTCVLVTVCVLLSQSLADEQDFLDEFLKREYTLAKPYRGEYTVTRLMLAALLTEPN